MKTPLRIALRSLARRVLAGWSASLALAGPVAAQALVDISNIPVFSARSAHPNVIVATSVEFPTVGSAYLTDQSGNAVPYIATNVYLGYFNPARCYGYTGGDPTQRNNAGYFVAAFDADANHFCGSNGFSGNFLNWATMSAIDEFRYAMTGGNRVNESGPNNGTIIERAYLPDGSTAGVDDFYASGGFFPRHDLNNGSIDGTFRNVYLSNLFPVGSGSNSTRIFVTNCRNQVYFGAQQSGNCASPSNEGGSFNVRVNVCDDYEGPRRTDLCLQYGSKYKPVGQMQRNADRMRFATFGYLMDRASSGYTPPCDDGSGWNYCRYGGVLRAPMKYVGPTQYDANLTASSNTKKEINSDGTLAADPEGTASTAGGTYSGAINFINKFGSNGIVNGVYKRYDPAGEMYYEALRYFQNLQPTSQAISGTINNATKDYFPILTTWTDPILSTCAANYIINVSDANTWFDGYLPGYTGSPSMNGARPTSRPAEGGLDATLWTQRIGALESGTTSITANDVRSGLSGLDSRITGAYGSYLVAGAAFWANTTDIRTDLPGKQTVKTLSFDVAERSIDVHDRQLYLMGKYGGFNNSIDRTSDTYANPFYATDTSNRTGPAVRSNAEWEDSPGSAYPANYLLASDPQKLINGIQNAFARITAQSGTISGAGLTSANLTYGAAGAYSARFDSTRWSGSVVYNSISVDTNGNLVVSTSPIWDAGAILSSRCGTVQSGSTVCTDTDTSVNKRNIVTTTLDGRTDLFRRGTRTARPFTLSNITASQDFYFLQTLNTNQSTNSTDNKAQERVNYLRGYRADEASSIGLRPRDSAMGDVVNSAPTYVGAPSAGIGDADYDAFFNNNALRTPAVYVGANDGMLHGIRASDGVELFAYLPGFNTYYVADLTNPAYQHEVFVDTVPKVQEVKVGGAWKTVLVASGGSGVQGIFGLDVTDPTTFGPSKVMFEFSDFDDVDFPSVVTTPEIAKLWVSGTGASKVYRYFAVVTGYNSRRTTVNNKTDYYVSSDTTNKAILYLIALDHTLGTDWVEGVDYYKFRFPATNASAANGLGPVSLATSKTGDQSIAAMYFGDLQGNLWKFNTSTGNPSTWAPALGTSSSPIPIFVAQDALNNRQPITARPELANGPFGSTLVFFGTGRFLGSSDLSLPGSIQSEYGFIDLNQSVAVSRSTDLVARVGTVSGSNVTVTGAAFSYTGPSAKKGWYLDFPSSVAQGERSITKPAIRTGLLTFTTLTLSGDLCSSGNGYVYQVNALTGLPIGGAGNVIGYVSTVGIPGPPRVVDLTLTTGRSQATGEQINLKTQTTLVSGSGGIKAYGPQPKTKAPPTQQINWREITNWNERRTVP